MKTRLLIIVVLIVVGSVATIVMAEIYRGQIDWKERVGGLVDENRRIEVAPANDPKDSFPEKYDAVIEGSIQICMGHKGHPQRSQCEIDVNSYIKFDGQRTEQFTVLVYDATLLPEPNTKAVFGLKYHPDENYYEIVETGFSRR